MSLIGKIVYNLYYKRKNQKAIIKKFGGRQNYLSMLRAEKEMKRYALNTLTINSGFNSDGKFKINFLTGDDFIHQTLFCTYSFFRFLTLAESNDFSVNYYSDGTLSTATINIIKARFPQIRVVDFEESKRAIRHYLPMAAYPYLNKKIDTLPLFKKLIFPHLTNTGLATFFDSDMLFLKRPADFLNWLYKGENDNNGTFCIVDVDRSYGYTDEQILKVWPKTVKNNINSGMYSINSTQVDLPFIERLVKAFEDDYGSQYYMEQLITAILLEKAGSLFVAPKAEYIVLPTREQVEEQTGTLHHFVNQSKEFYFKTGWRKQVSQ